MERLKEEVVKATVAHQAELLRPKEEHEKAAATNDDKLKTVVEKHVELEKALEARYCSGDLEWFGMLLVAQHLDEAFASKCFFVGFVGLKAD